MVLQFLLRIIAVCILAAVLVGVAFIPFVYPSTTLWYKFGIDRTMLQWGKVVGLWAATLLLTQLLFSARLALMERLFSPAILLKAHKINGATVATLAVIHPFLILASSHFTLLTLEKKNWPEGVGILLFSSIIITVVGAIWRDNLGLSYPRWRFLHRVGAVLLPVLFAVHVLNVSDTYTAGVPRLAVFVALSLYGLLWGWVQIRRLFNIR
jgi:predicted ferric reductase